jgi:tetratricopeptide (TPR) repeat protein
MVTKANTETNYRYPGIRPFYDNEVDRRLFFGRDTEKEALLHKILADNLVVLYASSGLGKTSLLNAGLSQALRDRGYIPFMVRFNDSKLDPVQAIYAGIKEIANQKSLEVEAGEDATLWQYFKTTYFWSDSNKMLTPVLILDQFEEFFTLYSPESRKDFIRQLADVVNNKIPASLLESIKPEEPLPYSDNPPNMKIIISIREDYVGQLEEMSREIPDILHHRFRLLPLSRENAREAIINPSQVQDETIAAATFTFAPNAVDMMLDFLCKRRERGIIKVTDEVESFQLQLLCRHIENMAREKTKKETTDIIVKEEDLGGEAGMQRVLQRFYDDQVKKLDTLWKRIKARKLCEKGLISVTNLRLSLEEGEIKRKFRVSENLLVELINSRLLRAEPRVGSVYYELSHDTLVTPIRESQRKRKSKRTKIDFGILLLCILIVAGFFIEKSYRVNKINKLYEEAGEFRTNFNYDKAAEKYEAILKIDKAYVKAYLELGQIFYDEYGYDKAIGIYELAIKNGIKDALIYYWWGNALFAEGKTEESIKKYEESIGINSKLSMAYESLGGVYASKKEFKKAIKFYIEALNIDKKKPGIYKELTVSYIKASEPDKAIEVYKEAIKVNLDYAGIYREIAEALKEKGEEKHIEKIYELAYQSGSKRASHYFNLGCYYANLKKYDQAIKNYRKAIEIFPKFASAYNNMGITLGKQGKYNEAIAAFKKAIKIDPKKGNAYYIMGIALRKQGKYNEAIAAFKKAIEIDPKFALAYNNIGYALYRQGKYTEAIAALKKAIEIYPGDILPEKNLAEAYLITRHYDDAHTLANDLLKEKDFSIDDTLAIRFISICTLVFQGNQKDSANKLKDFINYYKTIPGEYERGWEFNTIKTFITQYKKLPPKQKKLLLQLIDLLESPKKEGDKKLKELEASIREIFK